MEHSGRWRQVEELFHDALDRPESEREGWLEFSCCGDAELRQQVQSLLDSDSAAAGAFVGSRVERAVVQLDTQIDPARCRVGPYRLIRELGRGGMGAVYLAARADKQYESEVAIKLVRPGLDTDFILRRFLRERQILARLQHPNIARLFDGGTAEDGTPYIVMEYIQGSWITTYAAQEDLTVEERLRLFLPVCAAVEYAHRRFVVHRDLKPGNILIDQTGAPKLLDFGVSKLLHAEQPDSAETQGVRMITPDYASPEQIVGEPATVLSDIYSLGAVLYELLSGSRPHRIEQCTPLALERAICLDETIAPSAAVEGNRALARRLRGDLDNIVLRAMHKDPERRYPSVEQMADDIRRYLDYRPVVARPDSLTYRAGKFIRRNRLSLTLANLIVASLIGGVAVAVREARIAHERFDDVRKLATTFVLEVEQATRELPGSIGARQLIARTGVEYLGKLTRSSANDWELKRDLATAYIRIGELQGGTGTSNLGQPAEALKSFGSAQVLLDDVLKHSPGDRQAALDRMAVAHRLSNLHRRMGQASLAREWAEDGLRRAEMLLAVDSNDPDLLQYAAVFELDVARMRQQSGDLARAAEQVGKAIDLLSRLSSLRPEKRETLTNIAASFARLGAIQAELGQLREALNSYQAGVSGLEQLIRRFPNHTRSRHELMLAYSHVGDILGSPACDNLGNEPDARTAYGKMLEAAAKLYAADTADIRGISDYGIALVRAATLSKGQDRRNNLRKAHELLVKALSRNAKDRPTVMHKAWAEVELGNVALRDGDRASAVRFYQMAFTTTAAGQGPELDDSSGQRWLVKSARKLAEEQARSNERAAALTTLDRLVEACERIEARTPANALTLRAVLARGWEAAGSVRALLATQQSGPLRQQDLAAAHQFYARSVAQWRQLEPLQGFSAARRKELEATATQLARIHARMAPLQ
jgi:eukaryotic-like serine/threonine-protein kinase